MQVTLDAATLVAHLAPTLITQSVMSGSRVDKLAREVREMRQRVSDGEITADEALARLGAEDALDELVAAETARGKLGSTPVATVVA